MSKKKTMNKAPSKMTIGELCDEMSIRAEEHGALPAWLVKMYAEYIRSAEEIKKLRALVKELADAIEERLCDFDCETNGKCRCPAGMKQEECESFNMRPLVARAREVAK